jgi:hypothetical protein
MTLKREKNFNFQVFPQTVSLTVSHISAPRRLCDWSVAAWTSRQAFDERADQPSTHGCD